MAQTRHITENVERVLAQVLVANMREYGNDHEDIEESFRLFGLADRIEAGTATEQDWIDAIEEMDSTDGWAIDLGW